MQEMKLPEGVKLPDSRYHYVELPPRAEDYIAYLLSVGFKYVEGMSNGANDKVYRRLGKYLHPGREEWDAFLRTRGKKLDRWGCPEPVNELPQMITDPDAWRRGQ